MMKKRLTVIAAITIVFFISPVEVKGACSNITWSPSSPDINSQNITFTAKGIDKGHNGPFKFEVDCGTKGRNVVDPNLVKTDNSGNKEASYTYQKGPLSCEFHPGTHKITFFDNNTDICNNSYTISQYSCTLSLSLNGKDVTNSQISWNERKGNLKPSVDKTFGAGESGYAMRQPDGKTVGFPVWGLDLSNAKEGIYNVAYTQWNIAKTQVISQCKTQFLVLGPSQTPLPNWGQGKGSGAKADPCGPITNSDEKGKCNRCKDGIEEFAGNPGSWSALGCIPVGPEKFIQWLLNSAINIVGGLAFLMILFGSFKVATSSGNPESLNEGKEIIFAALAGLLFIVFSVILLKIIGHDILQIPGFQ